MAWSEILLLILSGVLVGFINTLAGGGTIITVSLLLFLGLPAGVANGTNRIAVIFQNLVAVASFKKQKILDVRKGLILAVPTTIGSIIGALVATKSSDGLMEKCIAVAMVLMLFFLITKSKLWLKGRSDLQEKKVSWFQFVIYLLIGFYGGFIHIGVGFFLLGGLVISSGYDLIHANAIKNLIVLIYSPFALIVFMLNDQVDYKLGLILSIGNVAGAWLATKYAVKWGANFVRWLLVVFIVITVFQLLGWVDFKAMFGLLLGR
jgi:uncharacterized membrane protein YfcA